nr:septal ring lytic transglycosylase RlpA family protein [Pseudovibrio axinellae]
MLIVFIAFVLRLHDTERNASSQCGIASWYKLTSRTASGDLMDATGLTAAHLTLPIGTNIHVTNLQNGKTLTVTVNDRGPYVKNRLIDLSKAAAAELGFLKSGLTEVRISVPEELKQYLRGHECKKHHDTYNEKNTNMSE